MSRPDDPRRGFASVRMQNCMMPGSLCMAVQRQAAAAAMDMQAIFRHNARAADGKFGMEAGWRRPAPAPDTKAGKYPFMVTIQVPKLIDFVADVFTHSESSPEEARRIATYLTTANLTGHHS